MAPELFENKDYTPKADVFSFGVILKSAKYVYLFRLFYGRSLQEKLLIKN